jgi:hypothetical protein
VNIVFNLHDFSQIKFVLFHLLAKRIPKGWVKDNMTGIIGILSLIEDEENE